MNQLHTERLRLPERTANIVVLTAFQVNRPRVAGVAAGCRGCRGLPRLPPPLPSFWHFGYLIVTKARLRPLASIFMDARGLELPLCVSLPSGSG
jgi:hypothetical protein